MSSPFQWNPFTNKLDHTATGGGGGGAGTITGNDGTPISQTANNWNLLTANTTVLFDGSGSTEMLNFGVSNLVLGNSMPAVTSGNANVGMGLHVFQSLTTGTQNTVIGRDSGALITSGQSNTVVGYNAGGLIATSYYNTVVGEGCLTGFNSGTNTGRNTAVGAAVAIGLLTGINNIFLGYLAAANYTGAESSNIIIGSAGVVGDSHVIRIGTPGSGTGQQNKAYMAGVTALTVAASSPVGVDTNGQFSDLGFGTIGKVLTSNGAGVSPSWEDVALPTLPLSVANGGTGNDIWPAHSIPIGDGTNAMLSRSPTSVVGAVLQCLGASTDPAYSNTAYPLTSAAGDLIYASALNVFAQLGIGSTNDVLTVIGGLPAWTALPTIGVTKGGTGLTSLTTGDLWYGSAANVASRLGIGSAGQVLTVSGGLPSWASPSPDALAWTDVTGTTQAMAINSGYLANNAGLVTLTLPSTAAQFSKIKVVGVGAGGWKIAQNANQKITWLGTSSTVGVSGFMSSVDANACVTLRCVVAGASTFWVAEQTEGNITLS